MDPLDETLLAAQAGDFEARQQLGRWLNDRLHDIFSTRAKDLDTDELVQRAAVDLLAFLKEHPVDAAELRSKVKQYAVIERREWYTGQKRERDRATWRMEHARALRPPQQLDDLIADRQKLALFFDLIKELAPSLRKVWLVRLPGYSFETIAAALRIEQSTARKYASEAKRTLIARSEEERLTPQRFRTPKKRVS